MRVYFNVSVKITITQKDNSCGENNIVRKLIGVLDHELLIK